MNRAPSPDRVLLLHPDLDRLGGIENSIKKISAHLTMDVEHFVVGRRPGESRGLKQASRLIRDQRRFSQRLARGDVRLVHANPSLDPKGLLREHALLRAARLRGVKTLVFLRGWRRGLEKRIDASPWMFRRLYEGVDAFMVLGADFERALRRWGLTQPIYRGVTAIDDTALEGFDLNASLRARPGPKTPTILFAGRVMKEKGIFTLIDAVARIQRGGRAISLVVAGDGPDLEQAREKVEMLAPKTVRFLGRVPLDEMPAVYADATLLGLPTEDEGLPNVLIEAMAFGLPVLTTAVGAIGDVFEAGRNGLLVDPAISSKDLAESLQNMLADQDSLERMSRLNHAQAKEQFLASRAAAAWESVYREILGRPA